MTQAIDSTDLAVAALQESVRHNEKNIDKLDRDLKDFRSETLKQFEKIDDRFNQLEAKVEQQFAQLETKTDQRFDKINDRFNQITMLLVTIVGLVVATIVKLVFLS